MIPSRCRHCNHRIPKEERTTNKLGYRCSSCWALNYSPIDWVSIQKKALKERLKREEIIERLKRRKNE
jgi:DNA-directed RNA polymerase subunit RPC12/RpoP